MENGNIRDVLTNTLLNQCSEQFENDRRCELDRMSLLDNIRFLGLKLKGNRKDDLPNALKSAFKICTVEEFNNAIEGIYEFSNASLINMIQVAKNEGLVFDVADNAPTLIGK